VITAYSSTSDQTDGDPFTTASGRRVFRGLVANNCLKFGTVVEINGRHFVVHDRLHSRYGCKRFDIWLPSRGEAIRFGVRRNAKVKVLERVGR
jgi:3D (Asp-Asp-Asp) domain-containing protein